MAQVPPSQGQPQSYTSQQAPFGSVAYSSGHPSMSGHSQNAPLRSAQYPSGGQPVMMQVPPGPVPMPVHQVNPTFANQQPPMGGHPHFIAGASGFAPVGTAYGPGSGAVAYQQRSTGGYKQPQAPGQEQPQPPRRPQEEEKQQQKQKRYVAVPPGMTRDSMRPAYANKQSEGFNQEWSFRDSFGNKRSNCCVIS